MAVTTLYLDQNYLSGIAKRKPAFSELAPVLRNAVDAGAIQVLESAVHERESRPRPDLKLMALLHELSRGRRLPDELDRPAREARRRMAWVIEHELPARSARPSDAADLEALALALTRCDLVTCDAFVAGAPTCSACATASASSPPVCRLTASPWGTSPAARRRRSMPRLRRCGRWSRTSRSPRSGRAG